MCDEIKKHGYRAVVDDGSDRMSNKIRKAQKQKIPLMLVVGDEEVEKGGAAVRLRTGENLGLMTRDAILAHLRQEKPQKARDPTLDGIVHGC